MERLLTCAINHSNGVHSGDLLDKYGTLNSRLTKLYKKLFSITYHEELNELGFKDVANILQRVREKRNDFMHGTPNAIDDGLVRDLVSILKEEHESWVAAFNLRATKKIFNERFH